MNRTQQADWGKRVSINLFLNTKLKPLISGNGEERYPLYVRVICKQQVSQFKYFSPALLPLNLSEKRFKELNDFLKSAHKPEATESTIMDDLKAGNTPGDRENLSSLVVDILLFQSHVFFLFDLIEAVARENFSIKDFPAVLKLYHELSKAVQQLSTFHLMKILYDAGYQPLTFIIDWSKAPEIIERHLNEMQQRFELPITSLAREASTIYNVNKLLHLVKLENALVGKESTVIGRIAGKINNKNSDLSAVKEIVSKAVAVYRSAIELTSH